jgi:5-methylcytosine-specific restriction endonuclease McrA
MPHKDPIKKAEYQREYAKKYNQRPEVIERVRLRERAWRENNREASRAKAIRWRHRHPEKVREAEIRYRARNLEKARAYAIKWRRDHPERARESTRNWFKRNPHLVLFYSQKRWAKKRKAVSDLTGISAFTKKVRSQRLVTCYYCEKLVSGKIAHFDHIIPLSKDGKHCVENLCVACPTCNHSKCAKLLPDWKKHQQTFLTI